MYKYLHTSIQKLNTKAPMPECLPIGCSEEEICLLEQMYNHTLPEASKEFLRWGGHVAGLFDPRYDMSFKNLYQFAINKSAERYLEENKSEQPLFNETLPQDALVLSTWNGSHFWFICLNEGDDPPVYEWTESEKLSTFNKKHENFSDYYLNLVEAHVDFCKTRIESEKERPDDSYIKEREKSEWKYYLERKKEALDFKSGKIKY